MHQRDFLKNKQRLQIQLYRKYFDLDSAQATRSPVNQYNPLKSHIPRLWNQRETLILRLELSKVAVMKITILKWNIHKRSLQKMKGEGSRYAAGYEVLSIVTTSMNTSSKALTQLCLMQIQEERENILRSLFSPTAHSNRGRERCLMN